jgi:hypothetical protein
MTNQYDIEISIIHHGEIRRRDLTRQVANSLVDEKRKLMKNEVKGSGGNESPFFEIFHQSSDLASEVRRRSKLQHLFSIVIQNAFVLHFRGINRIKAIYVILRNVFSKSSWTEKNRFRTTVEPVLFDKHIYLWTMLAHSDSRGMIIMEDDCRVNGSESKNNVFEKISDLSVDYDYVDIAGGYSFSQLGVSCNSDIGYVKQGVITNTTCGYFISRKLALFAITKIQEHSYARYLGVDFFLNYLNVFPHSLNFKSLLLVEPLFIHGSFSGLEHSSIYEIH